MAKPLPTKASTVVEHNSNHNDFTEGVFFKVPPAVSLVSSETTVDSSLVYPDSSVDSSLAYSSDESASSLRVPAGTSWKSTERNSFLLNQPLIVCSPEKLDPKMESDPVAALQKVLLRSKNLPSTDYYSSNHILVNNERVRRMIAPLSRMRELDDLAQYHAMAMAESQTLFHTDPNLVVDLFQHPIRQMGENVARGNSIREIHHNMMKNQKYCSDKHNIVHRSYTHMGMGTAKGKDGQLYLCQIFRG
jgi:uncharacterized protein YkwD